MAKNSVSKNTSYRDFTSPRYWPTWLGLGLMRGIALLPYPSQIRLGRALGHLLYIFAHRRRKIAATNIGKCFAELSATQQAALTKQSVIENGIGLIETCNAWWNWQGISLNDIDVEGAEYLEKAKSAGRGVILVGAHYTTLDMGGVLMSKISIVDVMYRYNKNPLFDYVMRRSRENFCNQVIERSNMRTVIRCLKKGDVVWYAPDQDYGANHSVFAPFFGVQAATITATSRLAKMNNSPVLVLSHHRKSNNQGYCVSITPPLSDFPSGDDILDATQINVALEKEIRKYPAQYMWVHRRFKTRPEGETRFY